MARRRLVPIVIETWTKAIPTKYGATKAQLTITPVRNGYSLVSTFWVGGKREGKPDHFFETDNQVRDRRAGLIGDNYKLTTKTKKVPEDEAPRSVTEPEVAERQYREELEEMLRPIRRKGAVD